MSHPTPFPVRLAAAAAASTAALVLTVSPALAQRAPDPSYAGLAPVTVVSAPTLSDSTLDVRQLAAGALAGLALGAGAMAAVGSPRRSHGHATA
ncbi:MAG: hypothetical protein ABIW80_11450 [Lapillicoccus sp.]